MNLQPDSALIKLPVCTIVSELRGELAVEKKFKVVFSSHDSNLVPLIGQNIFMLNWRNEF